VYGPAATALEAAAAWLGGASMAWITFWIKVMNGACFLAVAVVLDRLAGPDPARRARAALLWAINPLMLFWLVAGGHTDLLAVLPLLLALLAARKLRKPGAGGRPVLAAAVVGALAGVAIAVKVTFAAPVAGLAAGLWQALTGRHRTASLGWGIAAERSCWQQATRSPAGRRRDRCRSGCPRSTTCSCRSRDLSRTTRISTPPSRWPQF